MQDVIWILKIPISWPCSLRYVCLFVCGFSSHFRIFHSYGDHHHFRWRAANLIYARHSWSLNKDLPHLLWHGASVYSDHHRGPVTLTPIAECLAVELSPPVFTTSVCSGRDSNTQPSAWEANAVVFAEEG